MIKLLVSWFASALALLIVAYFLPGFHVRGIEAAMIAAAVIGLVNGTIGALLKLLTFPIGCITLGLGFLVINALMLWLSSRFVDGFHIDGLLPALIGAVLLSLVNALLRMVFEPMTK